MQLIDKEGLFSQLKNTGNTIIMVTDGGRWAASTREKSVNDLVALISRYFQPAPQKYVNHAWVTEIRNLLTNSRTEQPSYDLSLIHISEPTRRQEIDLVCRLLLEKKKKKKKKKKRKKIKKIKKHPKKKQ